MKLETQNSESLPTEVPDRAQARLVHFETGAPRFIQSFIKGR